MVQDEGIRYITMLYDLKKFDKNDISGLYHALRDK